MPKRVNNIYVKNITFSKLLEAHNKCKKHNKIFIKLSVKLCKNY